MNLMDMFGPLMVTLTARLPSILMAVLVLFAGWVAARLIGRLVQGVVYRITRAGPVRDLVEVRDEFRVDRVVGRVAYYLAMIFVLVLFFDILGVTAVMGPFLAMANEFTSAVPNLVKATLILLGAWVVATLLRAITVRVLGNQAIGRLLDRMGVVDGAENRAQVVSTAGNLVYYLVLVMFLPAVLGALNLQGLVGPFEQLVATGLAFLPKLVAALATVLVGYIVARVVRGIVTHFLASLGVDSLPDKVGMGPIFRESPLSRAIGTVVFVLLLIPVTISALETLGLEAISDPAVGMLTVVLHMVPNVAAALLLLAAGIALARWVGQLTAHLVENTGVARFLTNWGLLRGEGSQSAVPAVIGSVVTGVIVLLITAQVFDILRLTELSRILREILAYIPHVVVAVAILAAGWSVGHFADRSLRAVLQQSQYPLWLGTVARSAVMVLAGMMALEQLGVARSIVVNAFTILLGSLGLATALAVGLGGRHAVRRWLDKRVQ